MALEMQNQSKDAFLSDTKKNPKDCMEVTLRSRIENIKEDENRKTEKEKQEEIEEEIKLGSLEKTEES